MTGAKVVYENGFIGFWSQSELMSAIALALAISDLWNS